MHNVIKRPLITEKNTLKSQFQNEYCFEVDLKANRKEVKDTIEKLFKVKVTRVNTLISRRDPRRAGRISGNRRLFKKAIVKLAEGEKFEFMAG